MRRRHTILMLAVATVFAAAAGGCMKGFVVDRYPPFHTPELKTVAVLPFEDQAGQPDAGPVLAHHLAAALRANGTYTVLGPRELRGLLGAEKLKALSGAPDRQIARALAKAGRADAFITGAALAYEAYAGGYVWPAYGPGRRGRASVFVGHGYRGRHHYYHHHIDPYGYEYFGEARVLVTAALVRTSDAKVLAATPVPIGCRVSLAGYTPRSPDRALSRSVHAVMRRLVGRFAVVPVKVEIHRKDDFRIGLGQPGGPWRDTDEFGADDDRVVVLLQLPPEADRNDFRLTVTPKDDRRRVLAEDHFTWSRHEPIRSFVYSPRKLAAEAGPGPYRVHFHVRGKVLCHRDFRIKPGGR